MPVRCAPLRSPAGPPPRPWVSATKVTGAANAVTPAFADDALETLVLEQLEAQALARRGVVVTKADVAAATTDYQEQLLSQLDQVQSESETPAGCPLVHQQVDQQPAPARLPAARVRRRWPIRSSSRWRWGTWRWGPVPWRPTTRRTAPT